ncbi:GH12 family glycosyl hydrolase domain-containing protein [Sulfolobus acidocaldarius]|uniref:Cellulase n=4 Tax=Sulfolobus acidocaldarius TaxID=2285 RepID=A0A0U3FQH8_9CREN|nr:hypothetical protein [Sulfolobus acidocaldarius]AGE71770.1 hypothetical protein SacN8_09050 [Sulfolobus acidocaldarius N8]AGE74043.1 hypothetical protein SacRon12I_09070 [Sulfolobus acidocaldarius Ron12/I]ALU30030.1 hypothetical protein ATY89_08850 [Sulfolobus acidocaldarius]ALU30720.1 hypothetical protein ATZ20_00260 [Sulfolobus acidocaldarius]WCM36069.1 hypothetical protein GO597_10100 [Sulfolobus acidocaldarius DSM 639]
MKIRLLILLSAIFLIIFITIIVFIVLLPNYSKNDCIITLGNTYGGEFSILGKYQSDSTYAIGMVYSKNASLFVSPFLWNLKTALGYTNLTYRGNTLVVNVNFTNFEKINSNLQVDGYPGVMYGQEDWFPFAGRTLMPSCFVLPVKVISLPNFNSTLSYKINDNRGIIDDFSYDIWLTQNPNTTYIQFPDVEIMIWLYHNETLSDYFVKAGVMSVNIMVNGTVIQDDFTVYILPHTGSSNGWIGVYYISQLELSAGNITVPMSTLIKDSFNYIRGVFPDLQTSAYYLNAIQVGMEFNDINGVVNVGYTLYNWTITI